MRNTSRSSGASRSRASASAVDNSCVGAAGRSRELDGDASPPVVADVVQRQVARDAEDPRAARARFRRRQRTARDAEKDFLRQLAGVSLADDAAQVTENAVAMRREEDV